MFDLIIIGGGPAGAGAAVYAARKRLHTLLITSEFGGQSVVSDDIQNWIGTTHISGANLAKTLKEHAVAYADTVLEVAEGAKVTNIEKVSDFSFVVEADNGKKYQTKTILITSGSSRRKLPVKGADIFENKGLTYCASCDGPLFSGQDVVVVGGGNAGFETAAQLLAYCKSVTLLHSDGEYRAEKITVDKVLSHPNMRGIKNAETIEIFGTNFVEGLKYKDKVTGAEETINAAGIFIEIGQIPNSGFAKNVVEIDSYGRITIDPWTQQTKTPGIWAAGDVTNIKYHQNNIAAGDAVRALEDLYVTLHAR